MFDYIERVYNPKRGHSTSCRAPWSSRSFAAVVEAFNVLAPPQSVTAVFPASDDSAPCTRCEPRYAIRRKPFAGEPTRSTALTIPDMAALGPLPAPGVWLPPKAIDRLFEESPFF